MYTKTTWVNGQAPSISAEQLNKIEQGIFDAQDHALYLTTAPTQANPNGLQLVVLDEEPDAKYSGYIYFIKG